MILAVPLAMEEAVKIARNVVKILDITFLPFIFAKNVPLDSILINSKVHVIIVIKAVIRVKMEAFMAVQAVIKMETSLI